MISIYLLSEIPMYTSSIFCFLGLMISSLSFAQGSTDTLYTKNKDHLPIAVIRDFHPNGQLKSITYCSRFSNKPKKEFWFMLGKMALELDQKRWVIDSMIHFNGHERVKSKDIRHVLSNHFEYYEYGQSGEIRWITEKEPNRPSKYWLFGQKNIGLNAVHYTFEGRIGYPTTFYIPIHVDHKHLQLLYLNVDNPYIKVPNLLVISDTTTTIPLEITIPNYTINTHLSFTNSEGRRIQIPIEVGGYDLYESDFYDLKSTSLQNPLVLEDRSQLVLKAGSHAKLLRLYYENELVDQYSYAQTRTEISFKGFKRGMYLLEARDLGNMDSGYYSVFLK